MTPNERIVIYVMETYGRSLLAIACGLASSRWMFSALGQTGYGLYGLVGGLEGVIGFFTSLLSSSHSRFYAIGVGQGVSNCRKWFNADLRGIEYGTEVLLH